MDIPSFNRGLEEGLQKVAGIFPAGFLTRADPLLRDLLAGTVRLDRSIYRGLRSATPSSSAPGIADLLRTTAGSRAKAYRSVTDHLRSRLTSLIDRPGMFHADNSPFNAAVAGRSGLTDADSIAHHFFNRLRRHHDPDPNAMSALHRLDFRDMVKSIRGPLVRPSHPQPSNPL